MLHSNEPGPVPAFLTLVAAMKCNVSKIFHFMQHPNFGEIEVVMTNNYKELLLQSDVQIFCVPFISGIIFLSMRV